jgi:hypothetical protein
MKKPRSPKRLALEQKFESFLYWSLSTLLVLIGLIFTFVYFTPTVSQHEILATIRYQLLVFTTATLCCPAVPIPNWFPFPSQYRFTVCLAGVIMMELMTF